MASDEPKRWPGWMTRQDAAEYLSICTKSISALEDTGKINARRIGRKILISKSSLDEYMESLPAASATRHRGFHKPMSVAG